MSIVIYTNVRLVNSPSGGANSFLRNLFEELGDYDVKFTNDMNTQHSLIFLNGLTNASHGEPSKKLTYLSISDVQYIASKTKAPIIHRKVNFTASGPPMMREKNKNSQTYGDLRQIEISKLIRSSIFQSMYSYKLFKSQGFSGNYSIIKNGVDRGVFNRNVEKFSITRFKGKRTYPHWSEDKVLKLCMVSWSKDNFKGFGLLHEIDNILDSLNDVRVYLLARKPIEYEFKNVITLRPRSKSGVARFLKHMHGYLALARHETCSNALTEAICCQLPAIYVDSGSNSELIRKNGIELGENFKKTVEEFKESYRNIIPITKDCEEYNITNTARQYYKLFRLTMDN